MRHRVTRPYQPQNNGKAKRYIQSALREWAYGFTYQHFSERTQALGRWNHHYNLHRPHQGIGGVAPTSRLRQFRNNLLTLRSEASRTHVLSQRAPRLPTPANCMRMTLHCTAFTGCQSGGPQRLPILD